MPYVILCSAAFIASGLTLFSGFGLGTLLLPVFALFFPLPLAIALTAVVHLLNNLFKLVLLGRHAKMKIVWRFGFPALLSAALGAKLLVVLTNLPPILTYQLWGIERAIVPVKAVVAVLMIAFGLLELFPLFQRLTFEPRLLPIGGVLSGFFGGLSGHQGAFRSAFLIKCGLSKEQLIATGVVIACLVDVSRMVVYASQFAALGVQERGLLLVAATLSAFVGAWGGARLLKRVTMRGIQLLVALLLLGIALGLGSGVL